MAIHTLAIYNSLFDKKEVDYSNTKKIELINLVWDHKCERYIKESIEAKQHVKNLTERFAPIFEKHNLDFEVIYIP